MDAIVLLGMGDPFQNVVVGPLQNQISSSSAILRNPNTVGEALDWNSHFRKIRVIPPSNLWDAWKNLHKVIFHSSTASFLNVVEHNFVIGYLCNVEPDPTTLAPLPWPLDFPNKFMGKSRCNDQGGIP
jgi:hypothetical protein